VKKANSEQDLPICQIYGQLYWASATTNKL